MNRRTDEKTADRINLALLTRAAFDTPAALRFARISGLDTILVEGVFARDLHEIRQQVSYFVPKSDRRTNPRPDDA